MKKYILILALLGITTVAHAGTTYNIPFTGNNQTITSNVITATTTVQVSTYSESRNYVICHNVGGTDTFIVRTSTTGLVNTANNGYRVDAATAGVASIYSTTNHANIQLINNPGSTSTTVTCIEERL